MRTPRQRFRDATDSYLDRAEFEERSSNSSPGSTRSPYRGEAMLGWGFILAVLGGLGMLDQSSAHSACGNVLVRAAALSKCQNADLIWTAGVVGVALGVALIIAGAIMRSGRD